MKPTFSDKSTMSVDRMKQLAPAQFHLLVKMHLSFLLDLSMDECNCNFLHDSSPITTPSKSLKNFSVTPRRKVTAPSALATPNAKGVMEGAPLTMEGVCQVSQIIEHLRRPANLKVEGLFRKHGNVKKQQTLKERLNKGISIDLDSGEFSIHECAATLKKFLSDLSEPLLTDAYYKAHCQVTSLSTDEEEEKLVEKKINALQLLFLLIPEANLILLKDLLKLLHSVVENSDVNKMNSQNLATVFATHILCPRRLTPDALQSNHQLYIKAVSFMIDHGEKLFTVPPKLLKDIEMFWTVNVEKDLSSNRQIFGPTNSPVVNTIYSFVDRQKTKEASLTSTTQTALAELYAQVQAMPESAQKKRLINKLNDANGCGTPSISTKKRRRAEASSKLKNLLTPRASKKKEGKHHGSYNIDTRARKLNESEVTPVSSYKRQDSRGNSAGLVTFTAPPPVDQDGASPELKAQSTPKCRPPPPPPRVSSLKKERPQTSRPSFDDRDFLHTPRCRKPMAIGLSPMLEQTCTDDEELPEINEEKSIKQDVSTSSSIIEAEAKLLLASDVDPSDSLMFCLDGGDPENLNEERQETPLKNKTPNVLKQNRKRSITELGGPNPLVKSTTPLKNCENVYIETDF